MKLFFLRIYILLFPFYFEAQTQIQEFSIGSFVGQELQRSFQGMKQASDAKFTMGLDIKRARKEFWEKYPDKPGFEEASKKFAAQLLAKDLSYFMVHVLEGVQSDRSRILTSLSGGEIDGGIPESIEDSFYFWVRGVRESLGVKNNQELLIDFASIPKALSYPENIKNYKNYKVQRDKHEYYSSENNPFETKDSKQYFVAVRLRQYDSYKSSDALAEFDLISEIIGESKFVDLIQKFNSMPKGDDNYTLKANQTIRSSHTSGIGYFIDSELKQYKDSISNLDDYLKFSLLQAYNYNNAMNIYNSLMEKYGRENVLDFVEIEKEGVISPNGNKYSLTCKYRPGCFKMYLEKGSDYILSKHRAKIAKSEAKFTKEKEFEDASDAEKLTKEYWFKKYEYQNEKMTNKAKNFTETDKIWKSFYDRYKHQLSILNESEKNVKSLWLISLGVRLKEAYRYNVISKYAQYQDKESFYRKYPEIGEMINKLNELCREYSKKGEGYCFLSALIEEVIYTRLE